MKSIFNTFLLILYSIFFNSCIQTSEKDENYGFRYSFKINEGWYFTLGDHNQYSRAEYDHSTWRSLNIPHDWGVEGTYDTIYGTDWQSGYLPGGIGWYRKELMIKENPKNRNIELQFDGIYMNSKIYINGNLIGNQRYGYTSFFYEVSSHLKKGKNIIAIKVDHAKSKSARWYTGSGIYRNVWLRVTPKVHFKTLEQFVTTSFMNDSLVRVNAHVEVSNKSGQPVTGKLVQKVFDKKQSLLNTSEYDMNIEANNSKATSGKIKIENPKFWSLETPYMHFIVNEFYDQDNRLLDSDTLSFGIRKIEFSAEWGFKINNKNTKIKGVCMHHTAGIYGAAVPESILLYKLKMLKKMGCNAIRTAHNPFSPEFYTICDSLGLLVLDEVFDGWEQEKAVDDYGLYFEEDWQKDIRYWIKNNRNHPSVFMYSIGNEVSNPTITTQKKLITFIKKMDHTRPITQGGHDPTRGMVDQLSKTQLDIKGFNGDGEEIGKYESYHKQNPNIPIIATEVPHTYQTRGVYRTQTQWRRKDFPAKWEIDGGTAGSMIGLKGKCYPISDLSENEIFLEEKTNYFTIKDSLYAIINPNIWKENLYFQSSYDNATVRSSARKAWQVVKELDYVMGQFRWTAFDYLGETNQWPSRFANFGIIDIANIPKDHYYLYQTLWKKEPLVHILPHWTHPEKEGIKIPVVVYTNTDEVELFLNKESLGKKQYDGEQLVWEVPYTSGTIEAKAYIKNELVAKQSYTTAEGKHQLCVKANKEELKFKKRENAIVLIDIVDKNGNLFPYAEDYITVEVKGAGILRGLDNGNPIDLTPYHSISKKAFRGKLVAFIEAKASGIITVNVKTKKGFGKKLLLKSN